MAMGFGWAQWQRSALPYAGGLADQPARLMAGLSFIASLKNRLISEELQLARKPARRGRRG